MYLLFGSFLCPLCVLNTRETVILEQGVDGLEGTGQGTGGREF